MRIDEYISGLRNKGIVVSVQNERLAVSASDEVLTSEVVTELKSKKQEILDFFKSIQKTKQFKSVPKALESESYPLSTAQRRMYFLYELDKYSVSYNIPSFFRVGRNLDIAKFDKTLKELVKRHKSLRTIFENENGHLIQRVVKANRFEVNYVHGNSSEIDSYVKSFVKPFDLAKDLPYRVSLFDIAGEDYLLMIDSHHIINDGVSNDILMHDFWALYHEKPLIDTNIDYIDYAVWQQSEEYQSLVSSHKSYWLDKYNEDLTAIDLPLDYSRSKAKNSKGGTYSIELSSTLSAKIRLLASRKGVTTYTFFLSIYNILLSKLSNQRDIVVGTPTAGRHHSDLEGLVGMFVNTLALRNCVDSSLKFRDFLQKIQTDTALAFDHQLYQYQELVDALEVPRDTERNPLFDVFYSYNYDKRTEDIIKSDELNFIAHDVEYDVSKFDLELDILDKNEKFGIYFNYNFSLFKEDTIIKFTKYFEKIITQVLLNEEVSISKIDVLSREDKNQIVYEFNKPELGYNVNGTIINLIEEQVSLNPELIALYFGESEMSYDELNCKVNQLTHYLIKVMGIKKGDRIGLYQGRSPELIIGFLAILKSGAIYVPLDPDNPKDRISTLIKDSEMKLIITNNSNNELLTMMSSVEVVDLIARSKEIKNMSEANPLVSIQGNDSAYIIYTSGSTGKPKGVVITHDSLLDYSITFKNYFSLSLIDKVVQQASPAFDTVIEEIFPALLSGASIVIIKEGGRDINSLIKSIKQYKATVLSSVPVVLDTLNNYVDELKSLRVIISGGDLLLPRHINKLINNFDIYNTYGPSESTVCITYHKINSLENTSCIGKPIENRQVYILNNDNQLCPIGVTGELCVSGKGLAKEYLNDIVSTNNKFLENPIILGARMYRTGDAAKWNSDGSIEFLGRVDDQVKIRGVRIELGEIESCLESLSGVNQSLVLAQGLEGNKQLVAYLCGDKRLEDNEIRISLSSKLPNYMLPTTFMWLEKFPLNTNGKIDRRSLPVPDFISGQEYVAPSNEIEASLVVIWSEVLGLELEKISVTSDFFQLGGHSLNAITVANKLSEIFSVDVPLRELFTYRTISDLSVYIDSLDKSTFISIPKSDYQEYYPLSSAQRRMYFLYELDKEGTSYNMPSFYRVSRDLDVSQFNKSIEILVERHKSLRTVFELVEGSPVQRILDLNEFEVVCQQGNSEDVEDFVRDFVRPFDLSSEVPYRVCLVDVIGEDYLLMIDTHHIINDGVSNEVLMRDFWSLYQGKELSNNKVDYIDYAVWQQGSDHQELISSHKSYWLDLYDSSITSLELPIDYSRPKIQSDEGGVYSFTFDESQSLALRSLALKEGVTMYGLFLGLYNVLLSKLSNQEDIVVGTPTSGRNHSDIEDVVGMFVNTLALRTEVDSSKGFTAFLQELQSNTLDAFDHQLYQYEDLVDALGVSRDTGRNPLFDVFYSYAQGEVNSEIADSEGLIIKGHEVAYDIAKFDLSLQVEERECIGFSFNYRKDLFKESTIVQFSSYLVRIVTSVLNDASVLLRDIDILSQEEKDRLLLEFNNTSEAYDLGETVLDMFSKRVSESPDSEALVFEGASMSYKELDVRSDVWASHLVSEGVASGDIVGLMMTRSFDMVTGVLAILKSGGAYLPINIDQPISRTDYMLKECNVSLIITNIESSLGELKNDYECLTSTELDTYELLEENILPNVKVDDLAYVIYTSGSTGRPKGVMIKYKGITNLNCFQKDFFGIDSRDRILQFSPYYFDASVEQIWLALTSGATMVLVRKDFLLEIDRFKDYLAENKVTYIHATPSFLENLPIDELSTLRVVVSGGEKCSSSLVNKFIDKLTFINEYGPTEGTVVSTAFKVLGNLNRNIPIGRPIANTQAYVLNKDLNLLPERTIGELYVGGAGLAKGYINNEELTSERFIDNPYGSGKIYKTGDIVKWLSDGSLEYLGRNDNQVKIRGYRIELGEIESLLEELPSISQSLVLAQGPEGNKQLVAYLCGDKQLENNEIRTSLSSKLPNYMLPTTFIWLEKFPLNANGKIDRRSLPVPDFTSGQEYVAPTNKAEDSLVGIWSEVLGLESEKISVTSDFFQLGGHSLNAITVANKLSEIFSVDVPLRDLFTYRTISELSVHILEKERVEFESIPKAEYQEYYPLSSAQRRMYFLYEFDKESSSYNMPAFYRVSRDLDVSQFNKSIKALVERHKSLRTVFELSEGQPVQRILDASNFEIDYGQGESIGIKDYVKDFVRPFNLAEDLPYRVSLLDISGEDYLLMVDTHHIINDGVSNEILLRDFWSLYQGNDLSNNTIDYIDYSVWQQSFKYQELVGVHKSYWLDRYSEDLTALELPTDYSRPQILSNEGGVHSITLDEEQSTALRLLAASEGVTMYTMFLGIYNILLSKLSNQEDIVVGTPTAGRHHSDLEDVVGMFVNTLALRNQVISGISFQEFLRELQSDTLMAFDHQLYQYEELVDALDVSRETNRNPLFDVFYSYGQGKVSSEVGDSEGLVIKGHDVGYNVAKFDLSLNVFDGDSIELSLSYRTDLFTPLSIARFSGYLNSIIESVLEDKESLLKDIDVLSASEKERLLLDLNDTSRNYNLNTTVLNKFMAQAFMRPDGVALVFGEEKLTYQELDARSDLWASHLINLGVEKGSIVGLMMTRSTEMITAILGIMKAGGAYLPINPDQPFSRTEYMLEECEVTLILGNVSREDFITDLRYTFIEAVSLDRSIDTNERLPFVSASDLAYVIYTSGSTGNPKGVMIEHRSVTNLIKSQQDFFRFNRDEKILQFSPYYFDASVEQIWLGLSTGAILVMVEEEMLIEGKAFTSYLKEQKITHFHSTPSFLERIDFNNVSTLRRIVSGGEVCKDSLAEKLSRSYDFYNEYGPTETTVTSTIFKVEDNNVSIGRPIANTQAYVLDNDLHLLPEGVVGELYLGGVGLSSGYINNLALTEERFISNPFGEGRLYKTGDLVRWLPEGGLEYLGRNDYQVKLRGYRIELGEIESF
uniref:non-ribosomal peptide synthetase n=1 Tax=uncultured Tenacibaculum sp. TaxID=174713 RepID=UPI002616EDC2